MQRCRSLRMAVVLNSMQTNRVYQDKMKEKILSKVFGTLHNRVKHDCLIHLTKDKTIKTKRIQH